QSGFRLSNYNGYFFLDRRPCGGRSAERRREALYALLAHSQNRRRVKSEISRRGRGACQPASRRGAHYCPKRKALSGGPLRQGCAAAIQIVAAREANSTLLIQFPASVFATQKASATLNTGAPVVHLLF